MKRLKTSFMGIHLKTPIVIGASNLSSNIETMKRLEKAGAAAIVYKSVFEEQIQLEKMELEEDLEAFNERHAEMITTHPQLEHAGIKEHLLNIKKLKQNLEIPVIASLNAVYEESWVEYAKKLEEIGVDGLELNFYSVPRSLDETGESIEKAQLDILSKIKREVSIPVSVKLSPFYSNVMNVVSKMDNMGANGFVLFNRLFEPDIDVKNEKNTLTLNFSNREDMKLPLRYAGLLEGKIRADICSSTGIMSGEDVIKMLLAGANCVQIVSAVYKHNVGHVEKMIEDIIRWMEGKGYEKIEDFRGKLSKGNLKDPYAYERAQYVDFLMRPYEAKEPVR
ncbi:dihydroorotate dehydrogenase (fumarate) [Peptoclostridium litorale DSM 5388]|uniref:Dihydroorotate dehydrogenase 2 n=1 Tax=Peptoclostridium litorale DSM 5388 TaxID=1121324 RepID=A0A069RJ92_PEPLI|nr:dihydroorotate dehydrogenase-like protein [Peptoclostridium litorale]KDR96200.1 dihydroorotate dehydrogenase 2 [Peptoclostridium litorale DSM 5388]SIO13458.1 dihydroorotate dehydrogenase (fumarate) [Peptoclostridium litorale DSM 5388]